MNVKRRVYRFEDITLNVPNQTLSHPSHLCTAPQVVELAALLLQNAPFPLTNEQLNGHFWNDRGAKNNLDDLVRRLRQFFLGAGCDPNKYIDRRAGQIRFCSEVAIAVLEDLEETTQKASQESHGPKVSVAMLPAVNSRLVGRDERLKQLDDAWEDPRVRIVSIVAPGGVGKTSLAINWWHLNGTPAASRILGWSFYSQGRVGEHQGSADAFFDHALRAWFGVAKPPKDSWRRGELLGKLIRRERTLLILDGLEPLQFSRAEQVGQFKDHGMAALLKQIAAQSPGLCICTSRFPLADLEDYSNRGMVVIHLGDLTPEWGGEYLRKLGVEGREEELMQASEEFGNQALALTLLGNLLVARKQGDVRKRDTIPTLFADPKKGGHARRVCLAYEEVFRGEPEMVVLRMLGLFNRPVDAGAVRLLRTLPDDKWADALTSLKALRLIEYVDLEGPLECHPLIREHFADEYLRHDPDSFREAHSRLCQHYLRLAAELPETLKEMLPVSIAIYHQCRAGLYQEAYNLYRSRMSRGDQAFLNKTLGANGLDLSVLSGFFDPPWGRPNPSLSNASRTLLLGDAAFALSAVGRLEEALASVYAAAESDLNNEDWSSAAVDFANMSRNLLFLGKIGDAIVAAERAVDLANTWGDRALQLKTRCRLADAIHQSGDVGRAATIFEEAEMIQEELEPSRPLLHSIQGYEYCDLLGTLGQTDEVARRAALILQWREGSPLSDALANLLLGKMDRAIDGLRSTGTLYYLLRGLLARGTQNDRFEVHALAERCDMRLLLTDYHVTQARAYLNQNNVDEARQHYREARTLVEQIGYWRRESELRELEKVLA